MKIGLIGINMYAKYLNFACIVHVWAFQKYLKSLGYESEIIDYKPVYFDGFDIVSPYNYYRGKVNYLEKRGIFADKEKLERYTKQMNDWEPLAEERRVRYEKIQSFINENYVKTAECYDSDKLEVYDPGCDCYICVTDVIWGLLDKYIFDRGFMLGSKCMDSKFKISYSVSRGVPKPLNEYQSYLFEYYVKDIDRVSVREKSLSRFLSESYGIESSVVLDPVMLLEAEEWGKIAKKPEEDNYLVLYYVMEQAKDTIAKAVSYAKKYNLTIIEMTDRPIKDGTVHDPEVNYISKYDIGVEEWLGYLKYANCVFTNSFHGCCFSILFEKEMYVGKRNGDKVTNILETFGLMGRLLYNKDGSKRSCADAKPIDWESVRSKLSELRDYSKGFILEALEAAEVYTNSSISKGSAYYEKHRKSLKFPIKYHSGIKNVKVDDNVETVKFRKGTREYVGGEEILNDGASILEKCHFKKIMHRFIGWNLRVRIDNKWFWLTKDNKLCGYKEEGIDKKLLKQNAEIPYISVGSIDVMVVEARWKVCGIYTVLRAGKRMLKRILNA